MLLPLHKSQKKVVLASASPRRREILSDLGIPFEVVTTFEDDANNPLAYASPSDYVADTALMKAREVFERCQDDATLPDADIVIGADTVVVMDNDVLEKPRDEAHALAMLQRLSGQTHQVFTGVHIIYKSDSEVKQTGFVECTRVKFSEIDSDTMAAYIASGEPFGKAGSYGIQGTASLFVEWIHGDYWNVVGLPKSRLYHQLKQLMV